MNILITGLTGFAGSHLAEYIAAHHPAAKIHGIVRWRSRMENIAPLLKKGKVTLHEADLKDISSLRKALRASAPDRIFHLAAQSFVPASWQLPSETFAINAVGQINLFEAVLAEGYEPRIQIAGSSEEYGMVLPNEVPMKETNPLRPLSPYAVSKVAQDLLGYQYWQSYRLHIVRTRGFNHTGPRRGEVFVTSNFARQIAQIEKGLTEPVIRVGNLDAKRDFTDVRDTVRGYWLALDKGEPGEVYNIGSGTTIAMKDMLDILLGFSKVKVKVKVDPDRLRPSDVQILCADISKFKKATGWAPKIPFETTLRDLLDYWRATV